MSRKHRAKLSQNYQVKLVSTSEPVTIQLAEGEESGPAKFSGVAYSGGLVAGSTATPRLDHPYVIDLAGTSPARTIHANLDHKPQQRVGHVTDVQNDGKHLQVEGLLSAVTPYRDEIAGGVKNGQPWEVSIEGSLGGRVFVPRGKTAVVNGQTFSGPFYRMTKNKFTDIAFVSHGADDGNAVRIAASAAGEPEMNEFEKWMASCGIDADGMSDEQRGQLKVAYEAQAKLGSTTPARPELKSFEELAAESRERTQRANEIQRMALEAMRQHPMYIDQIEAMGKLAIEQDMPPEKFELEMFRATRTTSGTFKSQSRPEADPKVVECALSMAVGLPDIEKHYTPQTLDAVAQTGMRHFSLQQVLLQVASANGYVCRAGERIHNGNVREVLEYCFPPVHARLTGFSTINVPGILGNVANKELLAGYMEEDQTWREFSTVRSVSNFHAQTAYRMLDDLEYEEIGPDGEIKHGTLGEETFTRQAKTYAKMLAITRTDIINDDLGAFDDLRARLGRGAAKKFNNIFWAAFMNNGSFFTTARTNYIEGATSNLGIDGVGLQLGITAYRSMTSPTADGTKRMGVAAGRPTKLLVPPQLEFIARRHYQSTNLVGGDATVPEANIHAGLYRPIVQDRLSDTAFTGNSATAWYLFGDNLRPMVVSFLNGQQTPTVESTDADFNQLGIQFRGYHDFGADQAEYLAGIKSKGAS